MKAYKIAFLLIMLCCCAGGAAAQQLAEDYKKMQQAYSKAENFSMEILLTSVSGDQYPSTYYQQVELSRQGKNFFYKIEEMEFLITPAASVWLDKEQKTIEYFAEQKVDKAQMEQWLPDTEVNIDSLLKTASQLNYLGEEGGSRHYRLRFEGTAVDQMDIYINASNNLLDKLEYQYNKKRYGQSMRVSIAYKKQNLNPAFAPDYFSVGRYLNKNKKQWQPAAAYAGYEVLTTQATTQDNE